jgi:hypothetical protein
MEKEVPHHLQLIPPDARITFISQRISLMVLTFFAVFASRLMRAAAILNDSDAAWS